MRLERMLGYETEGRRLQSVQTPLSANFFGLVSLQWLIKYFKRITFRNYSRDPLPADDINTARKEKLK